MYTEENRKGDFDYFMGNYKELYERYGHKFLAIREKKILGAFDSVQDAISSVKEYEVGEYIIQECTGDETAYRTTIMRLMIKG